MMGQSMEFLELPVGVYNRFRVLQVLRMFYAILSVQNASLFQYMKQYEKLVGTRQKSGHDLERNKSLQIGLLVKLLMNRVGLP